MDAVLPVKRSDVERDRDLLATPNPRARDPIVSDHAVPRRRVLSFDRAFDDVPGLTLIS